MYNNSEIKSSDLLCFFLSLTVVSSYCPRNTTIGDGSVVLAILASDIFQLECHADVHGEPQYHWRYMWNGSVVVANGSSISISRLELYAWNYRLFSPWVVNCTVYTVGYESCNQTASTTVNVYGMLELFIICNNYAIMKVKLLRWGTYGLSSRKQQQNDSWGDGVCYVKLSDWLLVL